MTPTMASFRALIELAEANKWETASPRTREAAYEVRETAVHLTQAAVRLLQAAGLVEVEQLTISRPRATT